MLRVASVCSEWRNVIGSNFFNDQFGCSWLDCWHRISFPKPIVELSFPVATFSVYDPTEDILLLFRKSKNKEGKYFYHVGAIRRPAAAIASPLPYVAKSIPSPDYDMKFQYACERKFTCQHILPDGSIILLDIMGYIHHITYNQASEPIIECSEKSFCEGKSIKAFAFCCFTANKEVCLFFCGGLIGKTINDQWSIYQCSSREFISSGRMQVPRYYHSCAPTHGHTSILITGGKATQQVFQSGSILSSAELLDIKTEKSTTLDMNHQRNVHHSFLLSSKDVMILGGNVSSSIEKFDSTNQTFTDLPYHISLNWKSMIAPVQDKFAVERGNSRFLEIIDVYTPPTLFASHSLHRTLQVNCYSFSCAVGRTLVVVQNSSRCTLFYRIPFDELRITIPRIEEVEATMQRADDSELDGYMYCLDDSFHILEVFSFSISFPEEFEKMIKEKEENLPSLSYFQLHLKADIPRENKAQIIKMVTSYSTKLLFFGLHLDNKYMPTQLPIASE